MGVRAKVYVASIEDVDGYYGKGKNITLHVVSEMSPGDKEDNKRFFNSTPTGSFQLHCVNPEANVQFEQGKQYYVDFTPVEAKAADSGGSNPPGPGQPGHP